MNKVYIIIFFILSTAYFFITGGENTAPLIKATPIIFLFSVVLYRECEKRYFFILPAVSFLAGLTNLRLDYFPVNYFVIALAVVFLLICRKSLLGYALFFSFIGDIVLASEKYLGEISFLIGLASFFSAHIFYSILLYNDIEFTPLKSAILSLPVAVGLTLFFLFLDNIPSDMLIPVFAYISVIIIMVSGSILRKNINILLLAGASAFMISDMMIGINKFYKPFDNAHLFIMMLYYLAQMLLVAGFLKDKKEHFV